MSARIGVAFDLKLAGFCHSSTRDLLSPEAHLRRDEAKQLPRPPAPPMPAPVGRRPVFMQKGTGCVLGMDLDRGDNAHTVKRRLQLAQNVPTGETTLTFGDRVLESDLSFVRPDSPPPLTRNSIHGSCSTPCLCPVSKDFEHKDCSGLVEILGCSSSCARVKHLVNDVVTATRSGVDPVPIDTDLGGPYHFRNVVGDRVAIVKPTDEEPLAPNIPKRFVGRALGQPRLKKSVWVGETGFREVAAYLLDHGIFCKCSCNGAGEDQHTPFSISIVQ